MERSNVEKKIANAAKIITAEDVEGILQGKLSLMLREQCQKANLRYEEINSQERDQYIVKVVEVLVNDTLAAAGQRRINGWEEGWQQNLTSFKRSGNLADLIPKYHGKHSLLHWKQQIIRPLVPLFDYHIHCLIVDWALETYLGNVPGIYEFGCGPAYHLLRARRFNPNALLVGLDWATTSQEIIAEITASGLDTNMQGQRFSFFEPEETLEMIPGSGVLTVAALEQVGKRFDPFIEFLLKNKPSICVHFEPIDELMDPSNLIDRLSMLYSRKRNYLEGFLTRLRRLQEEGKVRILHEQRTYTGSFFIEGHSLVVWFPL